MKKLITIQIAIACLLLSSATFAQITNGTNFSVGFPPESVGWLGGIPPAKALDINNSWLGMPINFYTGGIVPAMQRMIILGNGIPNAGFVGIGQGFVTPLSLLHVDGTNDITGEVFRTNANATKDAYWRMSHGGPLEYGHLWNPWQTVALLPPCPLCPPSLYLTPNDLILDAPTGSFIVQGWSHDVSSGNDVLKEICRTTSGGAMLDWDLSALNVDGFRVTTQNKITGREFSNIDLFTGPGGETTIKMDRSGALTGRMNAFFLIGQRYGLVLDANITGSPAIAPFLDHQHIVFKINDSEGMRVCPGSHLALPNPGLHFVRIGENTFDPGSAIMGDEATRRLDVVDNSRDPQFRIAHTDDFNAAPNAEYTDFQTTQNGNLIITPRDFGHPLNTDQRGFTGMQTPVDPQNTLEIFSTTSSPWSADPSGTSGLRLTHMPANGATHANPGSGVLSVDANGDVIYVPQGVAPAAANDGVSVDATGTIVQLGGVCGNTTAKLLEDREIPMMGFNLTLSGQSSTGVGSTVNSLGIGTLCPNMPGRLTVLENATGNVTMANTSGVYSQNFDVLSSSGGDATGVTGEAYGLQTVTKSFNYGGKFYAEGAYIDYGVFGKADGVAGSSTFGSSTGFGGYFEANNNFSSSTGVQGNSLNSAGTGTGVRGICTNAAFDNIGVEGQATGITTFDNTAISAVAYGASGNNYGVDAEAIEPNGTNFGGRFLTIATNTAQNYALWAEAKNSSNANLGIYASAPIAFGNFAGFFNGDVFVNGTLSTSTGLPIFSDQMFKTNVDSIPNALGLIKQFKPKTYFLDTTNNYGINFTGKRQYGFIAQDVEQILPELITQEHKAAVLDTLGNVVNPSVDFKALNYIEFIPLLTRGIQEQSKKIDSLETTNTKQDSINNSLQHQIDSLKTNGTAMQNQVSQLARIIDSCCNIHSQRQMNINNNNDNNNGGGGSGNKGNTSSIDVKLTDSQSIVLDQNVPNPFAEQTTINYYLPDYVNKAQMLFYNTGGKLIQSVELTQRGQGQLNVFAQDLTNGLYTYTLVVDGKIFETKKMVKN